MYTSASLIKSTITSITLCIGLIAYTNASEISLEAQEAKTSSMGMGYNQHLTKQAPRALTNKKMVLSIQAVEGNNIDLYPTQGIIVQEYNSPSAFSVRGIGGANHSTGNGNYKYYKKGINIAVEKTADHVNNSSFITRYNFSTPTFGTFIRQNSDKTVTISGQFSLSANTPSASEDIAEKNHHNLTVAVNVIQGDSLTVPKGYYPDRALVLQRYKEDGTYSAIGFGPATIPHGGTYQYEKVSANVAIEQTIQVGETFKTPFTMVYFYNTPTSGTWYQDFGNGMIKFSGIFSTYQTQLTE